MRDVINSSAEKIKNHFDNFKSQREDLNRLIAELSNLLYPYKTLKASTMWDTTASDTCIKLFSLLSSLITPPGQRWHGLAEPYFSFSHQIRFVEGSAEAKRIKEWCDKITDTLFSFRERSGSGFSGCIQSFYTSVVEFGTGCFYIEVDEDEKGLEKGIRYISVPLADVYVSVNHQKEVYSVFWEFEFTAERIAHKWGEEALSSRMKSALDKKEDDKFQFIHAVFPKTIQERKEGKEKDLQICILS